MSIWLTTIKCHRHILTESKHSQGNNNNGKCGLDTWTGGKKDMDTHRLGRQNKEITQTIWDAEDRKQTGHIKAGNNQNLEIVNSNTLGNTKLQTN